MGYKKFIFAFFFVFIFLGCSGSGGSDTNTKTSSIPSSNQNAAPTAEFSGTPTSGPTPLSVVFTDQSTGNISSWSWNFGDGIGTSTARNPVYVYNTPGTYDVSLTVGGPGGSDTNTKTGYITVTVSNGTSNLISQSGWTLLYVDSEETSWSGI